MQRVRPGGPRFWSGHISALVDSRYFSQDHCGVLLVFEYVADWPPNLAGIELRSCHLVEQGLEQMVVRAVDQSHLNRRFPERLRCCKPSEPGPYDNDFGWIHILFPP